MVYFQLLGGTRKSLRKVHMTHSPSITISRVSLFFLYRIMLVLLLFLFRRRQRQHTHSRIIFGVFFFHHSNNAFPWGHDINKQKLIKQTQFVLLTQLVIIAVFFFSLSFVLKFSNKRQRFVSPLIQLQVINRHQRSDF